MNRNLVVLILFVLASVFISFRTPWEKTNLDRRTGETSKTREFHPIFPNPAIKEQWWREKYVSEMNEAAKKHGMDPGKRVTHEVSATIDWPLFLLEILTFCVLALVLLCASKGSRELHPADTSRLSNCTDCGKLVSKRAHNCPHCGSPISAQQPSEV